MQIKSRLTKLEQNNPNKPPCFCGKTLLDLWYGDPGADALTHCPKCKNHYDHWQDLAREAASELSENLTDA
jgi:hypothetical protein